MSRLADKIVGVIGGLGPAATMDFCNRVIRLTPVECDQDHLHLLIDNNPKIPDRNRGLAGTGPCPGNELALSAKRLQGSGAEFLVMPCNTAHAFANYITAAVEIPLLNIIDQTMLNVKLLQRELDSNRIGLLAVDGCRESRLFQDRLADTGFEAVCLDAEQQTGFMQLIWQIKRNGVNSQRRQQMQQYANQLVAAGSSALIAGCTEVPLALAADELDVPMFDTTEILAAQCVALATNQVTFS